MSEPSDLGAIKARNEKRRGEPVGTIGAEIECCMQACTDVDALLAEVERLQTQVNQIADVCLEGGMKYLDLAEGFILLKEKIGQMRAALQLGPELVSQAFHVGALDAERNHTQKQRVTEILKQMQEAAK
jgi:hypothetical protein